MTLLTFERFHRHRRLLEDWLAFSHDGALVRGIVDGHTGCDFACIQHTLDHTAPRRVLLAVDACNDLYAFDRQGKPVPI